MKAFSNDLRVRVINAKAAGHSVKDIASQLQVSQSEEDVTRLLELIKQYPDATLSELKDKGNFHVSIPILYRTLIRAGITYKKRPLERANKNEKM